MNPPEPANSDAETDVQAATSDAETDVQAATKPPSHHQNGTHPKLPADFRPVYTNTDIRTIGQATRFLANGEPGPHQKKTPEVIYADLIKASKVVVLRRRGKPPVIKWLQEAA